MVYKMAENRMDLEKGVQNPFSRGVMDLMVERRIGPDAELLRPRVNNAVYMLLKEASGSKIAVGTELAADMALIRKGLMDAIRQIETREGGMIRLRYRLEDGKKHTHEDIGRRFGISRQRVRQLIETAMGKLVIASIRESITRCRMQSLHTRM